MYLSDLRAYVTQKKWPPILYMMCKNIFALNFLSRSISEGIATLINLMIRCSLSHKRKTAKSNEFEREKR